MFSRLFKKIGTFADHHQMLISLVIAFSIISVSWGFEKILERHLLPSHPLYGYLIAIIGGLFILWVLQHFILHVW